MVLPQKLGHRFCEILTEWVLFFCPVLLGRNELLRRSRPQAAMGAVMIIHLPPLLKLGTRLGERQKPMLIQAFLAKTCIKRLNKRIIRWLPRAGEVQGHAMGIGP